MRAIARHVSRCFVAGLVALLPIGGLVLSIGYLETLIADSGIARLSIYFPGLGLILVVAVIYLLGLLVSTLLGRWVFRRVDFVLDRLPTLGPLYRTLKQILGYGRGRDAIFHSVVLVPGRENDALEIGLVTGETGAGAARRLIVFVPGSPNPTAGRLLLFAPEVVRRTELSVNDALKALVTLGKTELAV